MKTSKKLISVVLTLAMLLGLNASALAQTKALDPAQGTATITITNAAASQTYSLYKIFDATINTTTGSIIYNVPSGKTAADVTSNTNAASWFDVTNEGVVTAKGDGSALKAAVKTETFKTWAKGFAGSTPLVSDTVAATGESTLTFTGLPYGYYFIESSLGAAITVTSTNPNATIADKNEGATVAKYIIDEQGNKTKVSDAKYNENQKFNVVNGAKNWKYDATTKVNRKVYRYIVEDVIAAGMTYNKDVVVKVTDSTGATTLSEGATSGKRYTITYYTDANLTTAATATTENKDIRGFRITVPWTTDNTKDGDFLYEDDVELTVEYTAFLDPEKKNAVTYGTTANINTATLRQYDETIPENTDPPTVTGITGDNQTETYIADLILYKVNPAGNVLTGAQFSLSGTSQEIIHNTGFDFKVSTNPNLPAADTWYKLTNGSYTQTAPTTETASQYENGGTTKYEMYTIDEMQTAAANAKNIVGFVNKDGELTFKGLGAGTYTLSETVVPVGYNKADDITFTLSFDTDPTSQTYKTWISSNQDVKVVGNQLQVTVENNTGTELPETGGVGTTMFYAIGGALVIGAMVLIITRRRMAAQG